SGPVGCPTRHRRRPERVRLYGELRGCLVSPKPMDRVRMGQAGQGLRHEGRPASCKADKGTAGSREYDQARLIFDRTDRLLTTASNVPQPISGILIGWKFRLHRTANVRTGKILPVLLAIKRRSL